MKKTTGKAGDSEERLVGKAGDSEERLVGKAGGAGKRLVGKTGGPGKKPLKIAFFSDCYLDLTGGIRTVINAQTAALRRDGYEVEIFSTACPRSEAELEKLAHDGIYVVPSCRYLLRGLTPLSRRPQVVKKWLLEQHPELRDFDVFYVHYEAGCSIAALLLARELRIPAVQVMHGREDMGESNIIPRGFRTVVADFLCGLHGRYIPHPVRVQRDTYLADTRAKAKMWTLMVNHANFADLVITPSQHFRAKLQHYGVTQEIEVVPNSFDDAKMSEAKGPKSLQPGEPLRIIWHSRLSGEKRIMPFLQALEMVERWNRGKRSNAGTDEIEQNRGEIEDDRGETGVKPRYCLDLYGDGPEMKKAERYARQQGLAAHFHGAVPFDGLDRGMRQTQLDVLTSYNFDTFGMTLIEAEAYGTPVLIADPDLCEVVPRGGYLLSEDPSPEALARAIEEILRRPEVIREMSEKMLEHRTEVVSSKRIRPLERIFERLLTRQHLGKR